MKLHFYKTHNLEKLHDELLQSGIKPMYVEGFDNDIWITIQDDTPQEVVDKIETIINAHDPIPPPQPPTPEERLKALESAMIQFLGL